MAYYTDYGHAATNKYRKEKYKRLDVGFTNIVWDQLLSPAIEKSGFTQNSFIRIAIVEKILNEGLYAPEDEQALRELINGFKAQTPRGKTHE